MRIEARPPTRPRRSKLLRITLLLAAISAVAGALAACGSSSGGSSSGDTAAVAAQGNPKDCGALRLYTWEGMAPSSIVKPFEQKYGVPVKVAYIASPADAVAKLAAGGTKQYDLIFNEAGVLEPSVEAGVIKPIDPTQIPEFDKFLKFDVEPFEVEGQMYGVPDAWGVNPYLYSTEVLSSEPTSWAELWNPKLKDQVSLWEDVSLLYVGAAVLGFDKEPEQLWNLSQEQLDQIKDKMLELKGNVRAIWKTGGDLVQLYANHEVSISNGWPNIYPELKDKGEPIAKAEIADMGAQAYAEAAEMSVDITPDCEAAAYAFLRSFTSPKGQAEMAESSGYAPVNPDAVKYMPAQLAEETGLNDPQTALGSAIIKKAPADPEAYNQTVQEIIAGLS